MSYTGPITSNLSQIINYISNGRASDSTLGWSTYADAAGTQPVDGTGGSPNVTFTRDTTTPLRQGADFNFAKAAVNYQGQGVSYDFTIDNADLAKVLTVTFDYEIVSGTYSTGDLAVYLIQDPTGTPVVIQPAGYQIQSATVGTKMKQIATFQTASNVTSYRLCLHVASTSASAYTLAVDNVVVGPQVVQYGAPVTDWQSYTPTFTGFGTVATQTFWWRRIGDSVEIKGRFVSGTSTATEARVGLPSITSAGSDRIATIEIAGVAEINTIGAVGQNVGVSLAVLAEQSVGYVTFSARSSGNTGLTKLQGTGIIASGSVMTLEAKLPITGWSSTVQLSNDTDTRVVAARVGGNSAGQSLTANVTNLIFNTVQSDTHGAYNTSTGVFTAPVSGFYKIAGGTRISASVSHSWNLYVDGTIVAVASAFINTQFNSLSGGVFLNAGQQLTIRCDTSVTISAATGTSSHYLYIARESGPSAIAASELIQATYTTAAGQAIGTGATLITFGTKETDTHGAFNGTVFTAPVSGSYTVSARVLNNGVFMGTAATGSVLLYKNGSLNKVLGWWVGTGAAAFNGSGGSVTIRLNAGDTLSFYAANNPGTNLSPSGNENYMSIVRIGV